MEFISPTSSQFLFAPPKNPRVESVRVRGSRPGFREPKSKLAAIVKDQFFADRTLFSYSDLQPGHIRIIVIRRGKLEDPLQCDLYSVPLHGPKQPYYDALSYEWGDSPPVHKIKLRDFTIDFKSKSQDKNDSKLLRALVLRFVGANFFVRENLFQALRHLRQEHIDIRLWNDAICINQNNDKEKERQIAMMSDIYNGASQVSIWLGDTSEKSDMAMDFIKDVVELDRHQEILKREDSAQKWDALFELMRSRWFSRRWVIQELALARRAIVYCGKKVVHWNDFSDAVSIFKEKLEAVQAGSERLQGTLD